MFGGTLFGPIVPFKIEFEPVETCEFVEEKMSLRVTSSGIWLTPAITDSQLWRNVVCSKVILH